MSEGDKNLEQLRLLRESLRETISGNKDHENNEEIEFLLKRL